MGHFLWLSDLHVDPLYGTEFAVTHHNSMSDDIGNCTQNETLLQYPYGRTGCDSPISLLDSSLQSFLVKNDNNNTSTATSTKIDFILITGDLVRHGTDRLFSSSSKSLTLGDKNISDDIIIDDGPISFTKSILSTTIRSIKKFFPNVPIIPVLGNNDVTPDYYLDVNNNNNNNTNNNNGTSTNTILDMARDGLSECFLSEEESQTFAYGGYYSRIIQTTSSSSILILSLNTVIYSTNHQPTYIVRDDDDDGDDDPLGQFGWIESQLQKAIVGDGNDHYNNNTSSSHNDDDDSKIEINAIWIVGHIPPSIGSYRHSQQWSDRYVDRYITILKKHAQRQQQQQRTSSTTTTSNNFPTIQGHLFGHIHTEEFRLLTYNYDDDDDNNNDGNSNNKKNSSLSVPLFMSSSLTPVYGSNPSYRIVDYDNESGMLLDYTTHYLNLSSSSSSSINNDIDNDADDNDNGDDNKNWVWNELPSFTDVYNVSDLSSNSLDSLITRFDDEINDSSSSSNSNINNTSEGDSLSLFETFIKRQHVYSSYEDDDDDDDGGMVGNNTSIEVNWVCTLRAISKDAYMQCIEERWSSQPEPKTNHGGIILYLTASTLVIAIGVFVVFFSLIGKKKTKKRRVIKRRQYRRPTTSSSLDGVEIRVINNNDANNDDDSDSNLSFNSNSINGGGIAMTTIKTATTIGHATAGEFI